MSKNYAPERLLSYVVASDTGLAPNVTGGLCTLAVCKPVIRQVSALGKDWIVGLSTSRHGSSRVIYAMQVDEKLPYEAYFKDPRFQCKKPDSDPRGDNFFRLERGVYRIAFNTAAHSGRPDRIARDTKAPLAVVGERFWYFGDNAPSLPRSLAATPLAVPAGSNGGRRGHRVTEDPALLRAFAAWIRKYPQGVNGRARDIIRP